MVALSSLVARSRRMLRGSKREPLNVLAAEVPVGQGFITVSLPLNISQFDHICVGTEIMYVTSVDAGNSRANVIRGIDDTGTSAPHPAGAIVEVGWRFPTADLFGWLGEEVLSWPDKLFAVGKAEFHVPLSREVDLPLTRFRMPLKVQAKRASRPWVEMPVNGYRLGLGLPTSQFPSGNAFIAAPAWCDVDVVFEYAKAFDLSAINTLTTDTDAIGLTAAMRDIVIYGIAWRALAGDEANRTDRTAQPEPRIADEVRAGDALRDASAYKALRDQRVGEEQRRLRQLYPLRYQ